MTGTEALRILGLRPGATASEIKRAYRNAVKTWHPDRFQDSALRVRAQEKLKLINRAYEVLKAPVHVAPGPVRPQPPRPPRPEPRWTPPPTRFRARTMSPVALGFLFIMLSGILRVCADSYDRFFTPAPQPVRAAAVSQVSTKPSQWHVNRNGSVSKAKPGPTEH